MSVYAGVASRLDQAPADAHENSRMDFIGLIAAHGYVVVLAVAFIDQFGTPVPAIAVLLTAGAVAGEGQLSVAGVLAVATIGTILGDGVLYQAGRWRGGPVMRGLCSWSLAPDTCVRKTETSFARLGWRALVIAKFVPGLALFAAPVAGALRMPLLPFLVFDSIGSLLYNVVIIGLGYLLHGQLDVVVGWFRALGNGALPVVAGAIVAYWAWRVLQKQRVLRALRARRLTPEALRLRLNAREPLAIVDLRTAIAYEASRQIVPGALRLDPEDLEARHAEIPRDRDIVLYCTCPNETTSARVALALKKRGIERVFPLEGGLDAWLSRGYPVDVLP
jgi:membrane protein DedA with SNARE-associated domain/rhodanese-related sulfurtransferase